MMKDPIKWLIIQYLRKQMQSFQGWGRRGRFTWGSSFLATPANGVNPFGIGEPSHKLNNSTENSEEPSCLCKSLRDSFLSCFQGL